MSNPILVLFVRTLSLLCRVIVYTLDSIPVRKTTKAPSMKEPAKTWKLDEIGELVGGPQCGAKVHGVGGALPQTIYVGPRWLGDGYAAWGRDRCRRFPCCYVHIDAGFYRFQPETVRA